MVMQNSGQAVEYLRRSVERDKSADRDRGAGQRAANAAQAAADGVVIARTFDGDWGTSGGRGKRDKRAAMAELIDSIRAGEVSRVYCHTADRLARDVEYGMALWNACKDNGVVIRPGTQTFDPREPGFLTLWSVLIAQAEEDLDRITRKNQDSIDYLKEHKKTCPLPGRPHVGRCHLVGCTDKTHCSFAHRHGHKFYGELPGEDVNLVVEAYRSEGTVMGACRKLNGDGVKSRMGGPWATVSVREILIREGAMPHTTRRGAKGRAPFVLYGLLRCHCADRATADQADRYGFILTGSRYRNGPQPMYTTYKCHRGRTTPDHGLASIPEKKMLPIVMAEAAKLRLPDAVRMAQDDMARRTALAGRLERANELYIAGTIGRERYDREVAAVNRELDSLGASEAVIDIPALDWSQPPDVINTILRAMWSEIRLGPDMLPLPDGFVWRVPEWRRL